MDNSTNDLILHSLEVGTAALSRTRSQHIGTVGRLAQSAILGEFWSQFQREWSQLREEGRIKDDYAESKSCREAFSRMASAVEQESLESDVMEFIKDIFLNAASLNSEDGILTHYIEIAKELSAGEVQVLQYCYSRCEDPSYTPPNGGIGFSSWCQKVAESSGLRHEALVEKYADLLIAKKLLKKREHSDLSGFTEGKYCGMTPLGFSLTELASDGLADESTE
ncbi:MAG: hypothetical protein JJ916_12805 [Phycisphaerales bacterium]|nr:hypothetical protein [Phycisphaerales bacterium]